MLVGRGDLVYWEPCLRIIGQVGDTVIFQKDFLSDSAILGLRLALEFQIVWLFSLMFIADVR